MTLSPTARVLLALLLLGLLGAGFYVYQHLPALLNQQARYMLQQYGVDDIEFQEMQVSAYLLQVDELRLRGEFHGYRYEATVKSLAVQYDWRLLISQRVHAISVQSMDLAVDQMAIIPSETTDSPVLDIGRLLPQELISQLPVQTVQIKHWQLDYRALNWPPLSANGTLHLTEQLELQLESVLAGTAISVALYSSDKSSTVDAEIVLREDLATITTLSAQLAPTADEAWEWQLRGKWDYSSLLAWLQRLGAETDLLPANEQHSQLVLAGSGELTAQVQHPNTLRLPVSFEWSTLQSVAANVQLITDITKLTYPGAIEGLKSSVIATLDIQPGQVQLTAAPFAGSARLSTNIFSLPQDTQRWLRWQEQVPASWDIRQPITISAEDGKWTVQANDAGLSLGNSETQFGLQSLQLDATVIDGERRQLRSKLNTRITTLLRKQSLPQLELAFSQQGQLEQSALTMALGDTAQSIKFSAAGTVNLTSGEGELDLSARSLDLPYFTSAILPALRQFELLQSEITLSSGSIELDTALQTTNFELASWRQQSLLVIHDLTGSVGEYNFVNLGLTANWIGIERWKSLQPVELNVKKLDAGFEVRNITTRLSLPKPTAIAQPAIIIEEFSADVFGGQLYLPETAAWDFSASSNHLSLLARRWQLADVVALQQDEDIQASGTLEGKLPVRITAGRIIIDKGYLKAIPPGGSIRYIANDSSRALGESSKELAMALDLLSDFQYQVLSSEVELDEAGNLYLGLSLAGHNPERFGGRPVNFNINLEQNLDPLLQSLRVSDTLVEKIEKQLQ